MENWSKIYGTTYSVSDCGNVKNDVDALVLSPYDSGHGYLRVMLYVEGKPQNYSVHRLVAEAFIPNPEKKATVNHKDGCKLNNAVGNLEWNTIGENLQHAIDSGLRPLGEDHHYAKLSDKEAAMIHAELLKGASDASLATRFNISKEAIRDIRLGVSWGHLTGIVHAPVARIRKITVEDIPTIRNRIASGEKDAAIGATYGVCAGTINGIRNKKRWANY